MRWSFAFALMTFTLPLQAHEEELLEHHWADVKYSTELHFQFGLMLLAIVAIALYATIMRIRRARRCG